MMKLVIVALLVLVAVASAQILIGAPAAYASGAYGAHNAFAVSSQARVDGYRRDLIGAVPIAAAYY